MVCALLLLQVISFTIVSALKILIFQEAAGRSHTHFSGALVDVLAEAGHEVHLLTAEWNPAVTSDGTNRAASSRRIRVPNGNSPLVKMPHLEDPFGMSPTYTAIDSKQQHLNENLSRTFCELIANDDQLLQWTQSQKFDAVLTAMHNKCQFGLFYKAGLQSIMGLTPWPPSHYVLDVFGIDTPSSYTNDMMFTIGNGDEMNYLQRALNFFIQNYRYFYATPRLLDIEQQVWIKKYGSTFPDLKELARQVAYVFVNTNDFTEIPRPLTHKIIYIGGIGVRKPKKLDKEYDKLLAQRKGAVLVSFGSLARTVLMPPGMIRGFLDGFSNFPDYTFIWKVDPDMIKDEMLFSQYPNVKPVEWMPQNDLLNDNRTRAFITHTGLNSVEEAIHAGVPMITMPLFGDQIHNAAVIVKRRNAYMLDKWNVTKESVTAALQVVLYDTRYAARAREIKEMLRQMPTHDVKKIFREHVEFAARFKSIGADLQLHAVHLNLVQRYCLDIIAPTLLVISVLLFAMFKACAIAIRKTKFTFCVQIKSKRE